MMTIGNVEWSDGTDIHEELDNDQNSHDDIDLLIAEEFVFILYLYSMQGKFKMFVT